MGPGLRRDDGICEGNGSDTQMADAEKKAAALPPKLAIPISKRGRVSPALFSRPLLNIRGPDYTIYL